MQDLTLLFLVRGDQVLLAMKKRGFGTGRWNGVGGKLEPGETIRDAAVRECQEEIGVTPLELKKQAVNTFHEYKDGLKTGMKVHVFICDKWSGEPIETEEMRPKWFSQAELPFEEMWSDDIHWLPKVLDGNYINSEFWFDENDNITKKMVTVKEL